MAQLVTVKQLRKLIGEALDIKVREYRQTGQFDEPKRSLRSLIEAPQESRISVLELQYLIDEEFSGAVLRAQKRP